MTCRGVLHSGFSSVVFFSLSFSWYALFLFFVISLLFYHRPDMVDMTHVSSQTNRSNLEHAFCAAEQLGVARLLDPEGEIHAQCHVWFEKCSLCYKSWIVKLGFGLRNNSSEYSSCVAFITILAFAPLIRRRRSVSRWKISHHICLNTVWCLPKSTRWRWWNQS